MLRLIAATLEGQTAEFEVWQIDRTYVADDITYVRPLPDSPHAFRVITSSICCADCADDA
jgi:hypothetical protein